MRAIRAGYGLASWQAVCARPRAAERATALLAIALLLVKVASVIATESAENTAAMAEAEMAGEVPPPAAARGDAKAPAQETSTGKRLREILLVFYISQPFYYRSDVTMQRPDGTDARLKKLGWDGDALMPPIDGGIRSMEWWGSFGFMVDFLHNKAVARLGKGAHGRKIPNPVIETVDAEGRWKGKPIEPRVKLTDILTRLEFTHGHNLLIFTPMVQLGYGFLPNVRPYFGAGVGFAIPHVEVWFPDEKLRTNEYQYAGPAWQVVAGLEYRRGNVSYILEYKFNFAWIKGALTGEESWKNFNMPGDLWRQFTRWWRGEKPALGHFETRLGAHQIAFGAGYWWAPRGRPAQ